MWEKPQWTEFTQTLHIIYLQFALPLLKKDETKEFISHIHLGKTGRPLEKKKKKTWLRKDATEETLSLLHLKEIIIEI